MAKTGSNFGYDVDYASRVRAYLAQIIIKTFTVCLEGNSNGVKNLGIDLFMLLRALSLLFCVAFVPLNAQPFLLTVPHILKFSRPCDHV
ncbi:hypothetical protein H109_02921 [Trichophyton interdigitale MR816]|uniref:Uncharacterized protein n=1 Tax=Trichophyton interdigitale (strain MR816) TaxID=1215338 RepID=A0A059JBR7_TRIIM|nr:hypothetical protein H109_02921 [Trichophyton interdigitale MR816]